MDTSNKIETEQKQRRIQFPSDFTLHDLQTGVPVKLWGWLAGFFIGTFTIGMTVGTFLTNKSPTTLPSPATEKQLKTEAPKPSELPIVKAEPYTTPEFLVKLRQQQAEAEKLDAIFNPKREDIRRKNSVLIIDKYQNNLPVSRIPSGRFGFVTHLGLRNFSEVKLEIALLDKSLDMTFEIHKLTDGQLLLLAFVHEYDAYAFEDPLRKRKEFQIQNKPTNPQMRIVMIPLKNMASFDPRYLSEHEGIVAEIKMK